MTPQPLSSDNSDAGTCTWTDFKSRIRLLVSLKFHEGVYPAKQTSASWKVFSCGEPPQIAGYCPMRPDAGLDKKKRMVAVSDHRHSFASHAVKPHLRISLGHIDAQRPHAVSNERVIPMDTAIGEADLLNAS